MRVKQLRDIIKKIRFNPNKPGPMKIIADINDARFWQQRAVELIQESLSIQDQVNLKQFQSKQERFQNTQVTSPQSIERLIKAAQMIIMAAAKIDEELLDNLMAIPTPDPKPKKEKKSGRTKKKVRRKRKKA